MIAKLGCSGDDDEGYLVQGGEGRVKTVKVWCRM